MENSGGRAQQALNDLGKKIDELSNKAKKLALDKGIDIDKQLEKLKEESARLEQEFKEEFKDFKERNHPKWKETMEHLDNAGQEIKRAAEALFKRKSE
jgi:uncharacterized protein YukE